MFTFNYKNTDLYKAIKRRDVNRGISLGPVLSFLQSEVIRFDDYVFLRLCEDDTEGSMCRDRKLLLESGYTEVWRKPENAKDFGYEGTSVKITHEKFNIEFECVGNEEWPILIQCVNVSNLASFYNLNAIRKVLSQKTIIRL